jgi:hypothetical protein
MRPAVLGDRVRKIAAIWKNGMNSPDVPEGQPDPFLDEKVVASMCNGREYILYEEGDELPDDLRPKVRLLRNLSDDTVVWRYMRHSRFEEILQKRAIYFTPGYKLRAGEDYELRVPLQVDAMQRARISELFSGWISDSKELSRRVEQVGLLEEAHYLAMTGISCWHMNALENHAMWKIYVGERDGVAIKSTIGRLKRSINAQKRPICADILEYIDYEEGVFQPHPSAGGYERYFSKSHFYKFENEFRLIYDYPGYIWEHDDSRLRQLLFEKKDPRRFSQTQLAYFLNNGPFVPVDVNELISEVVVRGVNNANYFEEVTRLTARHLSTAIVRRSAVYKWPGSNGAAFDYDPDRLYRCAGFTGPV